MSELFDELRTIDTDGGRHRAEIGNDIKAVLNNNGHQIEKIRTSSGWGSSYYIDNDSENNFIRNIYGDVDIDRLKAWSPRSELDTKIILVRPEKIIKSHFHRRRSELLRFVTEGIYHESPMREALTEKVVEAGSTVEIKAFNRHRILGLIGKYTIFTEVWNNSGAGSGSSSDKYDIVRCES